LVKNQIDHIVPKLAEPIRLQDYAKDIFLYAPTKTAIKKAMKRGLLLVDSQATQEGIWIKGGETISLLIEESKPLTKELNLNLEVIYEDDSLAVINKPAGILVSGNKFVTIANGLKQNLTPSKEKDACSPQLIHRLDYGTTGVLLAAKTASALRNLSRQFQNSQVEKTYLAISIGKFSTKANTIDEAIDDKPSISEYEVIEEVDSKRFETLSLVRLKPRTGRRHQLRKHLSSIGHPILGDQTYGLPDKILKGKGIYLHASELTFNHPQTQTKVKIESRIPKKFTKIFDTLN